MSREEAIRKTLDTVLWTRNVSDDNKNILTEALIKALEQEPRKMVGSWIKSRDSYGNNHFTCPFCEHDIATKADTLGDNYCSNCGAKLQEFEPQESENKE